jgi:hypothetical protein
VIFGIVWHFLFNFRLAANLGRKHTFEKPAWLQAVSTHKYWYPCVCVSVCVGVLCFQKRGGLHTKISWYRTQQAEPFACTCESEYSRKENYSISYTDVETCLIGAMYPAREAETLSDLAHRFRSDIRSLMVCAVHVCVCVCVCACVRACARVLFLLICRSV